MEKKALLSAITLLLALGGGAVSAQEAAPQGEASWADAIAFDAFASATYTYGFDRPDSGKNAFRVFDFDEGRAVFDAATFTLQRPSDAPGTWGFRADLSAGSTIPGATAASGFFRDSDTGEAHSFDIQQIFVSYTAPLGKGLRLDLGKFFAPIGYESVDRYDAFNDNASRSFLFGYALPFTTTGLKVTYPFAAEFSAAVMLVQGWDVVKDNNSGKSVGATLAWTPAPPLGIYLNYIGGPERADDTSDWRQVLDLCVTWKAAERLTLGLNYDYGHEASALGPGRDAIWSGAALYATYAFTDRFSLALRAERFDDRDGARTGVAQALKEITLTPSFRAGKHFVIRGDLRRDLSDRPVFQDGSAPVRRQPTASINVLFLY